VNDTGHEIDVCYHTIPFDIECSECTTERAIEQADLDHKRASVSASRDNDRELEELVSSASVPTLASLFRAGRKSGLITTTQSYV
jgi:hypothetical protein